MRWVESISEHVGPKTFRSMLFLMMYVFIFIALMIIFFPQPPSSNISAPAAIELAETATSSAQISQTTVSEETLIASQHRHTATYVASEINRYTGVLTKAVKPINVNTISPAVSPVENILNHAVNLSGTHEARGISSKNGEIILSP